MILLLVSPPFRWGDENTHFLHAYRLAALRLELSPTGRRMTVELPRGVSRLEMLFGMDRLLEKRGRATLTAQHLVDRTGIEEGDDARTTPVINANYPLLGYVPQALGIALTRLCTRSVLLQLYGARLGNLLAWLVLVFVAIRLAPAFKLALAVLALAPMSMFVATTCSADAATNGLAFLWTAWIIRLALLPPPPRATPLVLLVLALALALVKMLYGPLVLLVLAVPAARFGGTRRRRAVCAGLVCAVVLVALGWALLSRAEIASGVLSYRDSAFDTNLAVLAHEPLRVAGMVVRTIFLQTDSPWAYALTASLWGVVEPSVVVWTWLVAVVAALLADRRGELWPDERARAIALAAALATLSAIALGAFLFWTPVASTEISGFQGRYAIPVLPALALALCPPARAAVAAEARPALRWLALGIATALLVWTIVRGVRLYVSL